MLESVYCVYLLFIMFDSDDLKPMSDVCATFAALQKDIEDLPLSMFTAEEKEKMLELLSERYIFMWSDAHGIAHMLDPRYMGSNLTRKDRDDVEQHIEKLYPEIKAGSELDHFKAFVFELKDSDKEFAANIGVNKRTVFLWWQSRDADDFPNLKRLALKVFSLCCSSSASERNFSTFAFIHNKLRNRLKDDKVEKLVHIFSQPSALEDSWVCRPGRGLYCQHCR